ncbi:HAMP domain-containing histidine kinase [Roseomonas hellenica]|nr:ATP-binding protein [Plastoroseomonas hellenica]MBR0644670.1 HAMP domain-containing histidine kinase [Plastoroseomonas hellenica]
MILLIQLRWIAVAGQVATIAVVELGLGIALPLLPMAIVAAALVLLNLASLLWLRRGVAVSNRALLIALMFDVVALTAQLHLSGGVSNPFTSLYLLQLTLGAILLEAWSTWAIVITACAGLLGLTARYRPLALPADGPDLFTLYILGMLIGFVLNAVLVVVFMTRINRNLRERDARLAALKQHAAEEDHIVRMGLLASGAAHELGTPLASVSVILNDWRRMPALSSDAELAQEIQEMQAAVQRCKEILTGILISAGEARGDAPAVTTVNAFLDGLVAQWRAARSAGTLHYANGVDEDLAIVSDTALKQVVFNVLDNAYEASPGWVHLAAAREGNTLTIRVSDAGPGFTPEMLAHFGKPYHSTKGRRGGGLGLFLVVNVVRKLGGTATVSNRPEGGAAVELVLPLDALAIGDHAHER